MGNYEQGIRWGVQKSFPFRMLEFGDPDNTGRDLAGHNEVLFRAEVVFAWYVFADQFAVIEDASSDASPRELPNGSSHQRQRRNSRVPRPGMVRGQGWRTTTSRPAASPLARRSAVN